VPELITGAEGYFERALRKDIDARHWSEMVNIVSFMNGKRI